MMMMMKKKKRRRKKKKKKSIDNEPDAAGSFSEPLAEAEMEVHVLAIDDSVIDRRIIESLLKTSSYKGKVCACPCM
jgi:PleD family two-component response regulator